MIDSTKSPVPAWKRYLTMAVMVALVLVAGYVLYTKEIHHSTSAGPASPPAATTPVTTRTTVASTPTTVPGGIAPSNRDPFG